MKLSYKWMCDFVELNQVGMEKIIEKINLSICEVDKLEKFNQDLENVVCVEIISLSKIDQRDLMNYMVIDGHKKYSIISGDLSLRVGDRVPLALPGKSLFGKKIEVSKIANYSSEGMLCSEKDLKLSENNLGVIIFKNDIQVGTKVSEIDDNDDYIFTIDNKSITHRPDLWSHFGFARELAFQLGLNIIFNPINNLFKSSGSHSKVFSILKSEHVHSYYGMVISNLTVKESIPKIRYRLEKCGIRSINNVVDVSNYALLEVGQPTHFFDANSLSEINISIEKISNDIELKLLDGSTKNCKNSIVISNSGKPVALAGVMGGLEASVNSDTKEVFLESAIFKREDIRATIKNVGIRSEASMRYEKGLNPKTPLYVINRIIELLNINGCPDIKCSKISGFTNNNQQINTIKTSYDYLNRKIGINLESTKINKVLNSLGFQILEKDNELEIQIPEFRAQYDITIQEDLVEEVGRTIGYGSISPSPVVSSIRPALLKPAKELERILKNILSYHLKFNEVYNYSFISELETKFEDDAAFAIKIKNSMPEEYRFMRTTLFPGLLKNLQSNKDRFENIHIYEFGRVYFENKNELGSEDKNISLIEYDSSSFEFENHEKKLIELRDKIQYIFDKLNFKQIKLFRKEKKYYQPTSCIVFYDNENPLAEIGILHPLQLKEYGIKNKVYMGKLYYNNILKNYDSIQNNYNFIVPSPFPQDQLDISILIDIDDSTNTYSDKVIESKIPEIQKVYVKSIYTGSPVPEGKKSVTYHFELLNYKETFTQNKIKSITLDLLKIANDNGFQVR